MTYEHSIRRYRALFAWLLRFYPPQHHRRYGAGMEQTFNDLLRERAGDGRGLFAFAAWMFGETLLRIIEENIMHMRTNRTLAFVLGMLCLLFVPFFGMVFRIGGWDWDATDFIIMAVLLSGAGVALAAATNSEFPLRKRIIGLAVVGLLFILYVHLAVGIVDTWPLAGS